MFSAIPMIAFDGVKVCTVCMIIFMYLHVIYVVKEVMSFWEFGQLMVVISPQHVLVSHVTT